MGWVRTCERTEVGVNVVDVTEAVAAEREGMSVRAQPILPPIKRVLLVVGVGGVPVRHHHFSEGETIEDRTEQPTLHFLLVVEAHHLEDEALLLEW